MKDSTLSPSDHLQELALGAALDALDSTEREELEHALEKHPAEMKAAIDDYQDALGDLGLSTDPLAPPSELKQRILANIAVDRHDEDPSIIFEAPGIRAIRPAAIDWAKTPLPGISIKTLRENSDEDYRTLLVRMQPGSTFPTHRHKQREELFLIEGDLSLQGKTMGPGDYCFAEPDSVHQKIETAAGAVFLVMHSKSDEFVGWRGVLQKLARGL